MLYLSWPNWLLLRCTFVLNILTLWLIAYFVFQADLIHLGAKFAPCMRKDAKIIKEIEKGREKERETACCIRNDDSGCVQSSQADCSVSFKSLFTLRNLLLPKWNYFDEWMVFLFKELAKIRWLRFVSLKFLNAVYTFASQKCLYFL